MNWLKCSLISIEYHHWNINQYSLLFYYQMEGSGQGPQIPNWLGTSKQTIPYGLHDSNMEVYQNPLVLTISFVISRETLILFPQTFFSSGLEVFDPNGTVFSSQLKYFTHAISISNRYDHIIIPFVVCSFRLYLCRHRICHAWLAAVSLSIFIAWQWKVL